MWTSVEKTMFPATAYGMLSVSAFCSFTYYITQTVFSPGLFAFGLYFLTGILGVCYYGFLPSETVTRPRIIFKLCKYITFLYGLPIILADLYYKYNFSLELIIAHLALPLLALVPYGTNLPPDKTLHQIRNQSLIKVKDNVDFVVFTSVVALSVISVLANNYFSVAAAFVYAVSHFIITESGYVECLKMPAESIYVAGMGLFCLLAMRAMMVNYSYY